MTNLLVVSGHVDLAHSVANKAILAGLQKEFPDAEFDDLIGLYPDYKIDVKAEQDKLVKADVIVLQFPFYWYSCPSIMRKWFEDVLSYGFAYGSSGKALAGKKLLVSFTMGAAKELYNRNGLEHFAVEEFMPQFTNLANLCSMQWSGFVCSGGYQFTAEEAKKIEMANKHVKELVDTIKSL